MKKTIILLTVLTILLSFYSCSKSDDGNIQDALTSFVSDGTNATQPNASGVTSEVDYSVYAHLLEESIMMYGGLLIEESNVPEVRYNCAGTCYANLVDLDNNGVLELITITIEDKYNSIENGGSAIDLYYDDDWVELNSVNAYTISSENELVILGNYVLSSYGNGGVEYGVEYSFKDDIVYLIESFRSTNQMANYYELKNATMLDPIASVELFYDYEENLYEATINGDPFDNVEAIEDHLFEEYGEVVYHPISWLTEEMLAELKAINQATYDFLGVNGSLNATQPNANLLEVDYGLYSSLLKAYELDYNIQNISATDYQITGMTLDYTYPYSPEDSMLDASGFCYSNLVDLDGNGILELVLIAYDEQEFDDNEFSHEDKVYVNLLKYPNIIKVYTIDPESGLLFLGSLPTSLFYLPVSMNYGIKYIVSENKTYISHENSYQLGGGTIDYYGLSDGYFSIEESFVLYDDGSGTVNGVEYSSEEIDNIISDLGESEVHVIQNMDDSYIEALEAINKKTSDFLLDYPISNFENFSGAYNNGQFYYMEYSFPDLYPPDFTIKNYYRALTMRDYDMLSELGIDDSMIDNYKLWHTSDEHTYVPGYIISGLTNVTPDIIENDELSSDISDYIATLSYSKIIIIHCRVNEVLDPHTTSLGLQVAGGTFDNYFILATDDDDESSWEIVEIFDDKFYSI